MLRCDLEDRPGSLAALAGAIARTGGDIQAVDVVETDDGRVLDDLVVVVAPAALGDLLDAVRALDKVTLVHAGPSRGHPGDAVTRLAIGLEALFTGAAPFDRGVTTLLGGLLRAARAEWVARPERTAASGGALVLPQGDRALILRRDYPFTRTERERARALLDLCLLAVDRPEVAGLAGVREPGG